MPRCSFVYLHQNAHTFTQTYLRYRFQWSICSRPVFSPHDITRKELWSPFFHFLLLLLLISRSSVFMIFFQGPSAMLLLGCVSCPRKPEFLTWKTILFNYGKFPFLSSARVLIESFTCTRYRTESAYCALLTLFFFLLILPVSIIDDGEMCWKDCCSPQSARDGRRQ